MLKSLPPFHFRPPLWAALLTVAVVAAFLKLGFWQIHRAEEKKAIISAYLEAAKASPGSLGATPPQLHQALEIHGRYDSDHMLLLDNQVSREQPGYHVWTPFRAEGSKQLILVDRGWVPMNPDRNQLPEITTPQGAVSLRGVWEPLPRPGLRLGADNCDRKHWPRVVQYPLHDELKCLLGPTVAEGILWLDPQAADGFRREWQESTFPPERHYGYAFQWFALATAVLVVFFLVNIRKVRPNE